MCRAILLSPFEQQATPMVAWLQTTYIYGTTFRLCRQRVMTTKTQSHEEKQGNNHRGTEKQQRRLSGRHQHDFPL
jgi:hypothetical protein